MLNSCKYHELFYHPDLFISLSKTFVEDLSQLQKYILVPCFATQSNFSCKFSCQMSFLAVQDSSIGDLVSQ